MLLKAVCCLASKIVVCRQLLKFDLLKTIRPTKYGSITSSFGMIPIVMCLVERNRGGSLWNNCTKKSSQMPFKYGIRTTLFAPQRAGDVMKGMNACSSDVANSTTTIPERQSFSDWPS